MLLLLLVLLVGLAVVADRVALSQTETRVADLLRTHLDLTDQPTVAVTGVPFLTQLAVGEFGHVELAARGIPAGTPERPLLVDRMELDLWDVRTSDRFRRADAERLTGSAGVTWAEITQQIGAAVTPQEDGRVQVDITADLYGQQVPFVVSAKPVLDRTAQLVHLREPRVLVARYQIPDDVVERMAQESVPPIELSLPMGLSAGDLRVGRTHLELDLAGEAVRLIG
ncbi:MAG TPA: DUF2993 domain-containing protein [Propionibacterium sp.]|nr:DUF2993 domain-containing protein [Propionibacterium sp.]